jgi:hypothetical protein
MRVWRDEQCPMNTIREITGSCVASSDQFRRDIVEPCRPVILRGLVGNWPVVAAGTSPGALRDYLRQFDAGGEAEAFFGAPPIAGKYYYSDGLGGFNFQRRRTGFGAALDAMVSALDHLGSESIYIGSLPVDDYLPGFASQNPMPLVPAPPRIWLGHASDISAHYDTADNLACVVAGTRRFTLYAPDLIAGLYVGPIDHTMAGQPVSLAASSPPDDAKFPLFKDVRGQALVAELGPGDALYLPKLWWHQVQSSGPLNGLVNYWWDAFAAGPDAPYTAMLLAMIVIAERPLAERRAWKALFDHYVFREKGHPLAHLPESQHGVLGPLKENYGRLRARIMQMMRGG